MVLEEALDVAVISLLVALATDQGPLGSIDKAAAAGLLGLIFAAVAVDEGRQHFQLRQQAAH